MTLLREKLLTGKLLFDYLDLTLCGVRCYCLEFVLSGDHLAVLRTVALEVDCVKFALCGADTAADTLLLVNNISTHESRVTFLFKIVNIHAANLTNLTKLLQKI